jgi:hypothetical protein
MHTFKPNEVPQGFNVPIYPTLNNMKQFNLGGEVNPSMEGDTKTGTKATPAASKAAPMSTGFTSQQLAGLATQIFSSDPNLMGGDVPAAIGNRRLTDNERMLLRAAVQDLSKAYQQGPIRPITPQRIDELRSTVTPLKPIENTPQFDPGGKTDGNAYELTMDTPLLTKKSKVDRVMPWEAPLKPGAWGGLDMRGMREVTPDQKAAMDYATKAAQREKFGKFYMDGQTYRLSNSDQLERERLMNSDTVMGQMARSWENTSNNSPIMKAYEEGTGDAAKFVLGTTAGIMSAPAVVASLGTIGSGLTAAASAPTITGAGGNLLNAGFTGYELYNAGKYSANAINDLGEGKLKDAGINSLKAGTYTLGVANAPLVQQAAGNALVEGVKQYKETGDLGQSIVRGTMAGGSNLMLGNLGHKYHINHSLNEAGSKYPTNYLAQKFVTPSSQPRRTLVNVDNLESRIDSNDPYMPSAVESTRIAQLPPKKKKGGKVKKQLIAVKNKNKK